MAGTKEDFLFGLSPSFVMLCVSSEDIGLGQDFARFVSFGTCSFTGSNHKSFFLELAQGVTMCKILVVSCCELVRVCLYLFVYYRLFLSGSQLKQEDPPNLSI